MIQWHSALSSHNQEELLLLLLPITHLISFARTGLPSKSSSQGSSKTPAAASLLSSPVRGTEAAGLPPSLFVVAAAGTPPAAASGIGIASVGIKVANF